MNARFTSRGPIIALLLTAAMALAGCASFAPDAGMGVVSDVAGRTIGKDVAFVTESDKDINDRIDATYRTKYRHHGGRYVDPMVAPPARAATIRLVPRSTTL